MSTYRKDEHLGHMVPLVETDDIDNFAVTTDKIAPEAVTGKKIANKVIEGKHIKDEAIEGRSIATETIESRNLKEKSIPERALQDKSVSERALQEQSVSERVLQDKSVTSAKLSNDFIIQLAGSLSEQIIEIVHNKIIAKEFGNSNIITVSQKLLTDTINDLYAKIREINGEPPVGLYLTATPGYFIGEEGCNIHIEAISTSGIFEKVAFFIDDVQLEGAEAESVYRLEATTHVDDTVTVKCKASILGVDYEVEKTIQRYNSFWLGAAKDYTEIMDVAHIIPFENNLRGAYNIACEQGDRIIIIVGGALKEGFIRADLNGFEIPFESKKVTIGGNDYWVMTSENQYVAGTYNIDVNG